MSTALMNQFRRLECRCARCHGPYAEGHICPDRVRHPGTEVFLASVAEVRADGEVLAVVNAPAPWDLSRLDDAQISTLACALQLAFAWANLPISEKRVALAILHHAGACELARALAESEGL